MARVFRRPSTGISPFRVLFWVVLLLSLVLFVMNRRPIVLQADNESSYGTFEKRLIDSDVLVILSESETRAGIQRGDYLRPYAWVDAFWQEYGPVSVVDTSDVTADLLGQYRFVVVTRSAGASRSFQARYTLLENYATNGGVLGLELPQGPLRSAFAADGKGGWRTPSRISSVDTQDEDIAEALMAMPLVSGFVGSLTPLDNITTRLAMDGAPVIYDRPYGRGHVIVFDFAFATQISMLQQGVSDKHMRVKPRNGGHFVQAADMIASSKMYGTSVPYADILEQFVVHSVMGAREPFFFFWPHPQGAHGALLSSHQSRYVSGRPLWMSVHERNSGARTVTFVAPPDPQSDTQSMTSVEHSDHAALLWVVDPRGVGLQKSWGFFGLSPIVQPLSLAAQRRGLTSAFKKLRETDIHGIRAWESRWHEEYTLPFRQMQAQDFRYDSTYGPVPGLPQGYLFGTCQPFRPVDTNGMPFALHEVPICFIDPSTDEDLQLIGKSLQTATKTMGVVHILTSADTFRDAPDMRAFDAWRDMLRFARQHDMWIGGSGQYIQFRKQRAEAQLHLTERSDRLRGSSKNVKDVRYILEIEVPNDQFSLAVPQQVGDRTLRSIVRGVALAKNDNHDDLQSDELQYAGQDIQLVRLAPGFTTLTIRYSN